MASYWRFMVAASFTRINLETNMVGSRQQREGKKYEVGLNDKKWGRRLEGKKRRCGRKTRESERAEDQGRGGTPSPSFLLGHGELLHPSDLVEQLWDEVLRGRRERANTREGFRKQNMAGSEMWTAKTYLSRFKTVNQQILQEQSKGDLSVFCVSLCDVRVCLIPTLTLAARSTSLGISSSSSTSISSSGMASS